MGEDFCMSLANDIFIANEIKKEIKNLKKIYTYD